ncbi:MAG TPA: alpha/beta hydrolase [Candidatus Microsaccharimonas sp.]|nr:alpha/beta hydrolase [Candidatus Microsaccharimonas sp.]
MKNAIILHGQPSREEYYDPTMPSMSNAHWIPWLQGQLLKNDIMAATPEVPHAFKPDWDTWVKEVERFDITPKTIIVGHSRGGDFWLRYLSEHKDVKVGRVVLVAPSLGFLTLDDNYFGEFVIDPDLAKRTNGITLFHSDNDGQNMINTAEKLIGTIKNLKHQEFHLGHFTSGSMGTTEFPELLNEVL